MQNEQYSRHLDWHFRMNRREKDTKRAISRTWYYEIEVCFYFFIFIIKNVLLLQFSKMCLIKTYVLDMLER